MSNKKTATKVATPAPEYKTLTIKHDKDANLYRVYDEKGNEYTADDAPRQIMMHLAYKAKQVLYFRGKKWRRKAATTQNVTVTVTPIPTPASETVQSDSVTA